METTIYLFRHSKTLTIIGDGDYQKLNENLDLSTEGEELAKDIMSNPEFSNLDKVFSSNYLRAYKTAKYLAEYNNKEVIALESLGERKYGVKSIGDLPEDFAKKQMLDEGYKLPSGESRKEVTDRMYKTIIKILEEYKGKRIGIVSHGTAISWLLSKWCEISYNGPYKFNGKIFFDGNFKYCETFKLIFDGNKLIDIKVIDIHN